MHRQHRASKAMPPRSRATPPSSTTVFARRLGSRLVKKAATAARVLLPPALLRPSNILRRLASCTTLSAPRSSMPLDEMPDARAVAPFDSEATIDDISVVLANISLTKNASITHGASAKPMARTRRGARSALRQPSHAKQSHKPPPSSSVVKFLNSLPASAKFPVMPTRGNVKHEGGSLHATALHPLSLANIPAPLTEKAFPFLRLPPELRAKIYTFIIAPSGKRSITGSLGPKLPTLALASLQLHAEILHQFYNLTTFTYEETPGTFSLFTLSSLGKFLSRIGPQHSSALKQLILTFREPIRGKNWDTNPFHVHLAGAQIVNAQKNASQVVVGLVQMGVRLKSIKIEGPESVPDLLLDFRGVWKRAMDVAIREAREMELEREICYTVV